MEHLTEAQLVEFFHISFLDVLSKRLENSRYILKGGANLRFFFGSVRYSEDLDLDLTGVKPPNLEEKVDRVLDSPALRSLLRIRDLEVDDAPAEQKVKALALRSETQARDVFDLDMLLRRRPLPSGVLDAETLADAMDLALRLPFAAFRDQVLPFLEPGVRELYESESSWEQMQTFVAEKLEQAR